MTIDRQKLQLVSTSWKSVFLVKLCFLWTVMVITFLPAGIVSTLNGAAKGNSSEVSEKGSAHSRDVTIVASIEPLTQLLRSILPARFQVETLLPKGVQGENYEPSPQKILSLSRSQYYFSSGLPFDERVQKHLKGGNPDKAEFVVGFDIVKKSHAHGHHHDKDHHDHPHPWLSHTGMQDFLEKAKKVFLPLMTPSEKATFETSLKKEKRNIDRWDFRIRKLLANYEGKSFFVYHPAWEHFAKDYGLKQVALENEGKEPSPKYMLSFISTLDKAESHLFIVHPQQDLTSFKKVLKRRNSSLRFLTIDPMHPNVGEELTRLAAALKSDFDRASTQ